mmetsp:Transcript_33603/g.45978  ORF Transcript_33603/g.45978 Transcript_33603/m.45978 type:complete len:80 (-) Transcript_33603:1382-1621(-)
MCTCYVWVLNLLSDASRSLVNQHFSSFEYFFWIDYYDVVGTCAFVFEFPAFVGEGLCLGVVLVGEEGNSSSLDKEPCCS